VKSVEVDFEDVEANGVRLRCAVAGSPRNPDLYLLHGFPESWRCWERQLPALAREFRCIAPDLRGYAGSGKPVRGYDVRSTAADLYRLIRHFSGKKTRVRVAGHDWGGYATWGLAYLAPEVLDRITVLNSPHPWMYLQRLFTSTQLFKAWYVGFFQVPVLAEWFLTRGGGDGAEATLRAGSAHFERLQPDYLSAVRQNVLLPGAAPAMLEWYRTAFRYLFTGARFMRGTTRVPVQMIWGDQDPALSVSLTKGLIHYAPEYRVDLVQGAGHYVTHEASLRVTRLLLDWMR